MWLYPVGCTDSLQPIDKGLGALVKVGVGNQLDLWLEDGDSLERRQSKVLTASDRSVLFINVGCKNRGHRR